jgi:hypothetical protein
VQKDDDPPVKIHSNIIVDAREKTENYDLTDFHKQCNSCKIGRMQENDMKNPSSHHKDVCDLKVEMMPTQITSSHHRLTEGFTNRERNKVITTSISSISEEDLDEDPDFIYVEEEAEEDWDEAGYLETEPTFIMEVKCEQFAAIFDKGEQEEMIEIAREFESDVPCELGQRKKSKVQTDASCSISNINLSKTMRLI